MNPERSFTEIMKRRQSVRTFGSEKLSDAHISFIQEYIQNEMNFIGPFGNKSKIDLVQVTKGTTEKGIKLGTYGFIKNPKGYLVGVTRNSKDALIDFAYTFHKLLLILVGQGIGTCWMGGTFNRNSFEKEISIKDGEFIPGISPIGYPKEKARVFDKALRVAVKADNKKPWETIFYNQSFDQPLTKEDARALEVPIEMVRLGPSASNKQPWRLVLSEDKNTCHVYIEHTPNYSEKLGYKMQYLDMGIAMCQFELACEELGIEGQWVQQTPDIKIPNEQFEYIASWERL